MKATSTSGTERRQGVALIVVLGFLSIMVMMAVAFLTQARVERMVAGASLESMRTRQMAQSAIAAGMQDYLNALKEVSQDDPKHDIFLSGDVKGGLGYYYSGLMVDDGRLAFGKVEDWLLDRHLDVAAGGGNDGVQNAEWLWVRERPGQRSRILGRYAYACFDMSGLVDANLIGMDYDQDPPDYGDLDNRNNVRKMVLDAVAKNPEKGGDRHVRLRRFQEAWRGFDSPASLLNLTDGTIVDGDSDPAYNRWAGVEIDEKAIGKLSVSDLSCYSYSATHLGSEAGGNLKVPCDAANIAKYGGPDFESLFNETHKDQIVSAIQDYESPQSLAPRGIDYPSVKNVPMFNEIGIRVGLKKMMDTTDGDGNPASTYNLVVYLLAEFWYPFPSKDNERSDDFNFRPSIGGDRNLAGDADIWVQLMGVSSVGDRIELQASGLGDSATVKANFNNNKPYYSADANAQHEVIYEIPLTKLGGDPNLPQNMTLRVGHIQISKDNPLKLRQGTVEVDSTPNDTAVPGIIEFFFRNGTAVKDGETTPEQPTWEAKDPRLNHRASDWDQTGPSPADQNTATTAARQKAKSATGIEPGEYLYCRNGPMHSPAELGYIPTIAPWQPLDIFSDQGTWLMNRLVSDPAVYDMLKKYTVFFTNGTINPYTRNTNVLNAAFFGVSLAEVPNMTNAVESGVKQLTSPSELVELTKAMLEEEAKKGPAGWSTILNRGDLNPDWNKNNRIALLDHVWSLFNESDRLFVVAVVAQSIKEGESKTGVGNWDPVEDMITGERRAVALCWMDGSAEGSADTLAQELNIIAFQYLNE